ncbi:MAG: hypothetical protein ACJ759_23475 [Thermoanaerobaculia bacterium]
MCKDLSNAAALLLCGALMVGLALWTEPAAQAMPNFARQYGVSCSFCHTVIPRVNRVGYEFRRAGWRAASEIGLIRDWEKDRETPAFIGANYFDARLQANVSYLDRNKSTDAGGYNPRGSSYSVSKIEFTGEKLGVGLRYDQFDPTDLIDDNDVSAFTGFVNVPMNNGLQFITELRSQKNEKGFNPSQTTNSLNVRFIYIW